MIVHALSFLASLRLGVYQLKFQLINGRICCGSFIWLESFASTFEGSPGFSRV